MTQGRMPRARKRATRKAQSCAHSVEGLCQIGDQVLRVLESDVQANQRSVMRPTRCRPMMTRIQRDEETLETAEARAHAEQFQGVQHSLEVRPRGLVQLDAEQTTRTGEIAPPECVAGRVGERGIEHALHLPTGLQPLRDLYRVSLVSLETHAQRSQPAQREVRVVRAHAKPQLRYRRS